MLRESRLPEVVRTHLGRHKNIKVMLARRHLKAHREPDFEVFVCFPARQLLLRRTVRDHAELLDVDVDAIARGEVPDWDAFEGPLFGVCTHGRHDACCAAYRARLSPWPQSLFPLHKPEARATGPCTLPRRWRSGLVLPCSSSCPRA